LKCLGKNKTFLMHKLLKEEAGKVTPFQVLLSNSTPFIG